MLPGDFLGVAPWVVISAAVSWGAQAWLYSSKRKDEKIRSDADRHEKLEIHKDEMVFQLLASARLEMSQARVEVEDLREEIRKLRAMEAHFYHFDQALEHLEALLLADTPELRAIAERNARAFLARMKRLKEAKGTLANEAQRVASDVSIMDQSNVLGLNPTDGKKKGK